MDAVDEILTRGVDRIYPSRDSLEKILRSGKKIRLYQGFDPTGVKLHIGHLVGLMKLRQFQLQGHHVIFLIGDGTGQAGDPSGKTRGREKYLSRQELRLNARDYVLQASKVINFHGSNKAEILYNADWLSKLNLADILNIAGHFTLQQLEERDLFIARKKQNIDINMREFLYPFLQGYDSVAMNVDLEIGGSDQTFNMLAGRKLVREMQQREKFVMTMPLLTDSGGRKIGKTEGNVIALTADPNDLYGMIMNLPDDIIVKCLTYITELPLSEISKIEAQLNSGANPMLHKKRLAFEVVKMLNSKQYAAAAQKFFEQTFQKKEVSAALPVIKISAAPISLIDFLTKAKLVSSKSQAKRLIKEKAVDINNQVVEDVNLKITPQSDMIVRVGKHRIIKLKT